MAVGEATDHRRGGRASLETFFKELDVTPSFVDKDKGVFVLRFPRAERFKALENKYKAQVIRWGEGAPMQQGEICFDLHGNARSGTGGTLANRLRQLVESPSEGEMSSKKVGDASAELEGQELKIFPEASGAAQRDADGSGSVGDCGVGVEEVDKPELMAALKTVYAAWALWQMDLARGPEGFAKSNAEDRRFRLYMLGEVLADRLLRRDQAHFYLRESISSC